MDRIVSQLLAELDSIGATVFVIGATNRPDLIDPSLLRPGRFETLLYLGVCDTREAQLGILKALTRKFSLDATLDIEMVASMCPFTYTGADFYALCADAQLSAMTRTIAQLEASIEGFNMNRTEPATRQWYMENIADEQAQSVIVDLQDFEEAVRALQPSVSASELQRYKTLRQQYQAK